MSESFKRIFNFLPR